MIISDSDYINLEVDWTEAGEISGSLLCRCHTSATAITQPGLAYADADALAIGERTFTAARGDTGAIARPFGILSYALAAGVAHSGNTRAQSDYFSLSLAASATLKAGKYSATLGWSSST